MTGPSEHFTFYQGFLFLLNNVLPAMTFQSFSETFRRLTPGDSHYLS